MLLFELTPLQVQALVETECTNAEIETVKAAVRELSAAVLEGLQRNPGEGVVEGLTLASEVHRARAHFVRQTNQIVSAARRRYLDRTLHGCLDDQTEHHPMEMRPADRQ